MKTGLPGKAGKVSGGAGQGRGDAVQAIRGRDFGPSLTASHPKNSGMLVTLSVICLTSVLYPLGPQLRASWRAHIPRPPNSPQCGPGQVPTDQRESSLKRVDGQGRGTGAECKLRPHRVVRRGQDRQHAGRHTLCRTAAMDIG